MGADISDEFGDIQQQLDDAKQSLVVLNENIRRFAGRSTKEFRNEKQFTEVRKSDADRERQRIEKYKRRSHDSKIICNRLSQPSRPYNAEEARPRITSRVIRDMPTREEVVEAQGNDSESKARNRRIFGSLLGTLQKFCQEESRLKQKEDKKAQIERKLEAQELQERESLKKERETLFLDRRRKQLEIKKLELKMRRLQDLKSWETSTLQCKNSIRTKAKPHIFFKPRVMSTRTEQLLQKCNEKINHMIKEKHEALQKELQDLESNADLDADLYIDDLGGTHMKDCDYISDHSHHKRKGKIPNRSSIDFIIPAADSIKGELDSKENSLKNGTELTISSSIIVVKQKQNDIY